MPIDDNRDKRDIMQMMQGCPRAANHNVLLANWREPDIACWSFNNLRQLQPPAPIRPVNPPAPLPPRAKIWITCLLWMRAGIASNLMLFWRPAKAIVLP